MAILSTQENLSLGFFSKPYFICFAFIRVWGPQQNSLPTTTSLWDLLAEKLGGVCVSKKPYPVQDKNLQISQAHIREHLPDATQSVPQHTFSVRAQLIYNQSEKKKSKSDKTNNEWMNTMMLECRAKGNQVPWEIGWKFQMLRESRITK